jgi:hypothetical protein
MRAHYSRRNNVTDKREYGIKAREKNLSECF